MSKVNTQETCTVLLTDGSVLAGVMFVGTVRHSADGEKIFAFRGLDNRYIPLESTDIATMTWEPVRATELMETHMVCSL